MDLLATLVVGGLVGWLAGLGTEDEATGLLAHVLIGVVGSVLGVWLLEIGGSPAGIGPLRWAAALAGAASLVALVRVLGSLGTGRT